MNQPRELDPRIRRQLRQIAHHLDPVIIIGDHGVSDAVIAETERALADHELIKVRIHSGDREERHAIGEQLAQACNAARVQSIGRITVLFRRNPEANPKLSNLARYGG